MEQKLYSLNGMWDYSVKGGQIEKRRVPSSHLCVGDSIYSKEVWMSIEDGQRALLCFEGVAYEARVEMNGIFVGDMLPYSTYRFDVGNEMKNGSNEITVFLRDINASYGPAEGWESYSGIIRDVYIEVVGAAYISDFIWKTCLDDTGKSAVCSVETELTVHNLNSSGRLLAYLSRNGNQVCFSISELQIRDGIQMIPISFDIAFPQMWSPDSPTLYELKLELEISGRVADTRKSNVGFKDFGIRGNKFFLNGNELFLRGVCRHDCWGMNDGFTLTDDQMKQDMQMIKHMGANFVRLVHYPHNRKIIELADSIGLLVSEEPGLWWSDMSNKVVTDAALEVMRRTVIRDRNHVSVAFWLAFNECIFTEEYLDEIVGLCRSHDPTRPVSGANCMNLEMTKSLFSKHSVDFYTYHPYGVRPENVTAGYGAVESSISIENVLKYLNDKPVVFTEWGGHYVHDNPALFKQFCDTMTSYSKNIYPEPTLSGMCYWEWADTVETNRGEPACRDGMLIEGLVDIDRNIRENYHTLSKAFAELDYVQVRTPSIETYGLTHCEGVFTKIDLSGYISTKEQIGIWDKCLRDAVDVKNFFHKKKRRLSHGPSLPEKIDRIGDLPVSLAAGRPLVINSSSGKVKIGIGANARTVYFAGHVTFAGGYPISGDLDHPVARYVIAYSDQTMQEVLLRNGVELATALGLFGPSRIDPRASMTHRILRIQYDMDWEIYYVNLFRLILPSNKSIDFIEIEVLESEHNLLLYGITIGES